MLHFIHVILAWAVIAGAWMLIMFDGGDPHHKDHNRPPWNLQ